MPVDLTPLLPHMPVWALVLFRLSGLFLLAPLFGGTTIPTQIKVFLALGLSFCIYPTLLAPGHPAAAGVRQMLAQGLPVTAMVGAVASELLIGVALGTGALLPMVGMQVAGQVIDQQMGIGLGGIYNPELEEDSGVSGQFFYLLAMALFVILGGHRVLLSILVGTFQTIPLGGFVPDARVTHLLLSLLGGAFELAMRVSAPVLCLVFLETVAMGFLARTVPQLNIMSVGFPLRIMAVMALLIVGVGISTSTYIESLRRSLQVLEGFFLTPAGAGSAMATGG
ncbi:MAG: flagellar biosynthetic protein FliR [Planctomycetota bacterium]|nr:flagellar biosynthetic protein FliR [Planctomycetota bacterium]